MSFKKINQTYEFSNPQNATSVLIPTRSGVSAVRSIAPTPTQRVRKRRSRRKVRQMSLSNNRAIAEFSPRMTLTFVVPLTTATTTGIINTNLWLGSSNTASSNSLGSLSTQYSSLAASFYWQTLHKVRVEYVPLAAFTVSGTAGSAFWPDPTTPTTVLTTNQAIAEKPFGIFADVKSPHSWVWSPTNEQEREAKEVSTAGGVTGPGLRNFAPGLLCFTAITNATGSATLVGNMIITVDLTFTGMI